MITWDPDTTREHEIGIAAALLAEAANTDDPEAARRLRRAATMHLETAHAPAGAPGTGPVRPDRRPAGRLAPWRLDPGKRPPVGTVHGSGHVPQDGPRCVIAP